VPERIEIQLRNRLAGELAEVHLAQPIANRDLHSQGGGLSPAKLAERNTRQPCRDGLADVIVVGVADQE
jgi:hypothetical protein